MPLKILLPRGGRGASGKESACNARDLAFDPWVGKIPLKREWLPALVFFPGESHEQRSLAGHSPRGGTELDTTEVTYHAHITQNSTELKK